MSYKLIDVDEGMDLIERGFIPYEMKKQLKRLYIIAKFNDEGDVIAAATFGDCDDDKYAVILHYIYVIKECRGNHHAISLYEFAKESLFSIGFNRIICERIVEEYSQKDYNFITSLGLDAIYTDLPVLRFVRGHFLGRNQELLFRNIEKSELSFTYIKNYSDRRLRLFLENNSEHGIVFTKDDYNPKLCVFGLKNGKIVAALVMKIIDEHSIISDKFYVSDEVKNCDYVLPFMIAYVAENSKGVCPNIENIFVMFEKDYRLDAIIEAFGKEDGTYLKEVYEQRKI